MPLVKGQSSKATRRRPGRSDGGRSCLQSALALYQRLKLAERIPMIPRVTHTHTHCYCFKTRGKNWRLSNPSLRRGTRRSPSLAVAAPSGDAALPAPPHPVPEAINERAEAAYRSKDATRNKGARTIRSGLLALLLVTKKLLGAKGIATSNKGHRFVASSRLLSECHWERIVRLEGENVRFSPHPWFLLE